METLDLGLVGYEEALGAQLDLLNKRMAGEVPDTLIFCEHEPVVTLGRTSDENSIDIGYFKKKGIPVMRTGRGGKNTYHSPGQLLLYPIVDLSEKKKDVSFYIDLLETAAAAALNQLGVPAERDGARRGVWAGGRKIAFSGVAFKKWVTYHGLSVNLNNDIEPFLRMDPCGEKGIIVTSAKEISGRDLDMEKAKQVFKEEFAITMEKFYGNIHAAVV